MNPNLLPQKTILKNIQIKSVEWLLRITLSFGMLIAVAYRYGLLKKKENDWGNWEGFLDYDKFLNPYFSEKMIHFLENATSYFQIALAALLLVSFKTPLIARATGFLLLILAQTTMIHLEVKAPLDYSIFVAAAAAFALSIIVELQRSEKALTKRETRIPKPVNS